MHMHDETEDAFGFGAVRNATKEKIRQIKPSAPPDPPPDFAVLDQIAGNAGFISREAPSPSPEPPQVYDQPRMGRPRGPEAFIALNMRAPQSLANAFKRWCEENRYSYPSALAEIMRRAGIPTR